MEELGWLAMRLSEMREREILWREGREGRKGEKKGLINSAQTALVFKDQICHFFYS